MTEYQPDQQRYDGRMSYRYCGKSGLKLPEISLGFWQNFGGPSPTEQQRAIMYTAFDCGITHFDLANNYGPPFGNAELNAGKILRDLPRDELIISTKAGYNMWPGPYGEWGSRKYLLASLDQSLKRLDLDYVDIFYSHRFDPNTPMEETLGALHSAVQQGKSLYVGISSYDSQQTRQAAEICRTNGFSKILIHQPNYSLFNRWIEKELLGTVADEEMGVIAFCPLFQGLLTDKYLAGIPKGTRATMQNSPLRSEELSPETLSIVRHLNEIAQQRDQTLAQMALAWILRDPRITSVVCGASRPEQIQANCQAISNKHFSTDELQKIDAVLEPLTLPDSLWASE
ncbi:MAG: aldo/keto reductase [Pirellulaceae bacterium]|jgi:L-glyceraldehyde 3-phosphate reductase|nr:aldo/keto reductase [Mariniblastus sp.]MDB4670547.1 aldo/keto reductase [Pirellulaceae bacterium]MDB4755982.1 aldo/keto reductase [Mariniblastus sp.]MDG2470161.1 aldo/keto reductase [Pirellulaceae bacterium]